MTGSTRPCAAPTAQGTRSGSDDNRRQGQNRSKRDLPHIDDSADCVPLPKPRPDTAVVVTGASNRLGAEMARELSRRGYALTLVALNGKRLRAVADELET